MIGEMANVFDIAVTDYSSASPRPPISYIGLSVARGRILAQDRDGR